MFSLKKLLFILVAGFYISNPSNGQQQKLFPDQENYFSSKFELDHKSAPKFTKTIETTSEDGSSYIATAERTLTVRMKSQVNNGRGLTVYDSGKVVYIIDNYQQKLSKWVLLMDNVGHEVFTIRKRCGLGNPSWEGYKGSEMKSEKASFSVTERSGYHLFGTRPTTCEARYDDSRYRLEPCRINKSSKLEFKITDADGKIIAEMKQKYAREGVPLERDVLSLKVVPEADVSFVVALVAVFGLINGEI